MNTDRELLELAAKAVGRKLAQGYGQPPEKCLFYCDDEGCHDWNPLDDDGDALRLAVKLKMDINYGFAATQINVSRYNWAEETDDVMVVEDGRHDPYAATRHAIVRAAAEIGRSMG